VIKKTMFMLGVTLLVASIACGSGAGARDPQESVAELFPDIEGWEKDGPPALYTPETLFDYIDGGADLYLAYAFEELASQSYDSGEDKSITIDIYRHGTPADGFGIYSQEKSSESDFLPIGAQGYHDKGVLNFFKGRYYVKMMAFGMGDGEIHVLMSLAETIAGKLDGEAAVPTLVHCFPEKNKIANSERYIAKDFLGHSFLHSAFVVDYRLGEGDRGAKCQAFIIEAADEAGAQAMIKKYLEHAEGGAAGVGDNKGIFRLVDPYYRSSGTLNLKSQGRYIWGLFGDDPAFYEFYLEKTGELLAEHKLL
jgi:hypothetical protein